MTTRTQEKLDEAIETAIREGLSPSELIQYIKDNWESIALAELASALRQLARIKV